MFYPFDLINNAAVSLFSIIYFSNFLATPLFGNLLGEIAYLLSFILVLGSAHYIDKWKSFALIALSVFLGLIFGSFYLGLLTAILLFVWVLGIRWTLGAEDYSPVESEVQLPREEKQPEPSAEEVKIEYKLTPKVPGVPASKTKLLEKCPYCGGHLTYNIKKKKHICTECGKES